MDFFNDLFEMPFLRNAVLAGFLAAIAAGTAGSLVVVRRSTYLAGAVSHSILAGLGLAVLLQRRFGVNFLTPTGGAFAAAVFVALLLSALSCKKDLRRDTVLSAVWTGGMALGVTFVAATPGYQDDLMSYLFGSILLVAPSELAWMAALDIVIVLATVLCYNRFLAVAFDAQMARLRGVNVAFYETLYHVLTALAVVLLVRVAGIVLAVALLTLPAAAAGLWTKRLDAQMILASLLAALLVFAGLAIGYPLDLPPGATIVELAALVYLIAAATRRK